MFERDVLCSLLFLPSKIRQLAQILAGSSTTHCSFVRIPALVVGRIGIQLEIRRVLVDTV